MSQLSRRGTRYGVESLEPRTFLSTAGSLDTSFGSGGQAVIALSNTGLDLASEVIVQPDGKIVVGGRSAVPFRGMVFLRLNPDGALDTTFGNDGKVRLDFGDGPSHVTSMALQPDGKIVAAGFLDREVDQAVLVRLNPNGTLDGTFSENGLLLVPEGQRIRRFHGVAIGPGGTIVAGGDGVATSGARAVIVARYMPNGTPDVSFEGDGRADYQELAVFDSLAVEPDGRIVISASDPYVDDWFTGRSYVFRIGTGGEVVQDLATISEATGRKIAVLPDGKLLLSGRRGAYAPALWRFHPNGTPDDTFADGADELGEGSLVDFEVQPDGRIVGVTYLGSIGRLNPNGSFDPGFAKTFAHVQAIALYGPDKLVAAGSDGEDGAESDTAVARYHAGPSDPSTSVATLLEPESDDEVSLRRDGSWTHVWVNNVTFMAKVSELTVFSVNTLDGTDVLTLDFSAGSPLPDSPMSFSGGTGNDTIEIIGGDATEVVTFGDGWVGANFARADYVSTENFLVRTMGGNDTVNINRVTGPAIARGTVAVVVEGGAGDDTFRVGDRHVDTHLRDVAVTLRGGSGADTLIYDDSGGAPYELQAYLLDQDKITKKFRGVVTHELRYDSMSRIEVEAGAGMDLVHVRGLGEPVTVPARTVLPVELVVNSGGGNDDVVIGDGLLDNVVGPINVDAGAGNDDLVFDDDATLGAKGYTITGTSFARNPPFRTLTYANAESVRLEATRGNDAINVHSTTAAVTINARDGADLVVVGRTGGDGMNRIDAPVIVNGGDGSDRLVFEDAASGAAPKTYSLGPASFDRTDFPVVTYATTERVELRAGSGPDQISVVPAQDVSFGIDGMQPTTQPGDRLTVVPHGATGAEHTPRPDFPGLGEFTFANRQKVDYQRVENARFGDFVAVHLFYNGSAFDGNDFAANAADDGAIATDKQALFAGGTASFANVSSYHRGINGLMVDLAPGAAPLAAADFSFRMGNGPVPSAWPQLPAAFTPAVVTRAGAGVNGTNRVTLTFPDGAVRDTWLAVTVLANANTGLTEPLTFYVASLVGEVGDPLSPSRVTVRDMVEYKRRPAAASVPLTSRFDINRDGAYTAADRLFAQLNQQQSLAFFSPPLSDAQQAAAPSVGSVVARSTARRRGILSDSGETGALDA